MWTLVELALLWRMPFYRVCDGDFGSGSYEVDLNHAAGKLINVRVRNTTGSQIALAFEERDDSDVPTGESWDWTVESQPGAQVLNVIGVGVGHVRDLVKPGETAPGRKRGYVLTDCRVPA